MVKKKTKSSTSSAFQGSHGRLPQVSGKIDPSLIGVLSNEPVSFGPLHNGQRDMAHLPDPGDKEPNHPGGYKEEPAPAVADESVMVSQDILDQNVITVRECCFPFHLVLPPVE